MAEEKKIFSGGGMDMDTEERFIRDSDYKYALNCRVTSSDEDNQGAVENVRGNKILNLGLTTLDGTLLDDNSFKVIGHYEDKKLNILYYFVCQLTPSPIPMSWVAQHCIVSNYSYSSSLGGVPGVFKILYQDAALSFNQHKLITGVNIIHSDEFARGGLLYWTDDLNPPRKINALKAYWWTQTFPVPAANPDLCYQELPDLDAIVSPPIYNPTIGEFTYVDGNGATVPTSGNNTAIATNDIKNTLWQFKYRYIYRDSLKSSWSPISTSGTTSFNDSSIDDLTISNYLEVKIDSGVQEVKAIELAVRENEDKADFYLITKINKDDTPQNNVLLASTIGALSTTTIATTINANIANNSSLYFIFTGSEPRIPINLQESNKLYDDVPLLAKSQEIIDGNRLAYGNVVNGYDQVTTDTEFEVVYRSAEGSLGSSSPITYSWGGQSAQTCYDYGTFVDYFRRGRRMEMHINVGNISAMQAGSIINISIQDFGVAAYMQRKSGGGCGTAYKSARMSNVTLTGLYSVGPTLTSISDLANLMNSAGGASIVWNNVDDYDNGGGDKAIEYGLSHQQGSFCTPATPFTTYNGGAQNNCFSASGTSTIVFKFYAVHKGMFAATLCQTIEFLTVCGFDGETLWSVDTVNNAAATTSIWPATVSSGAPLQYGGFWNAENATHFTGASFSGGFTYSENWVTTNNSSVNGPAATAEFGFRGFKSGTKHNLGIVYYDRHNRSGTVNPCGELYIPFRNERGPALDGSFHPITNNPVADATASIHFKINHNAPLWATHWQWLWAPHKRGDFLHITVNSMEYDLSIKARYRTILPESQDDVGGGGGMTGFQHLIQPAALSAGYVKMDMEELIRHSSKSATDVMMWEWAPGDRVRILDLQTVGAGGPTSPNYAGMDFEIIGIEEEILTSSSKLWYILEKAAVGSFTVGGDTIDTRIELYRPKKIKGDVYYEFGHVNPCSGGNHSVNYFSTEEQITPAPYLYDTGLDTPTPFHFNQSAAVAAEGTLGNGDIYFRDRLMITAGANLSSPLPTGGVIMAEDYSFSDYFKSKGWDLGRPNAYLPDFKQTRRAATIFFSEPFIPNTAINGLGTFYPDVSFQEYDKSYNSIQKLFSINDKLIILQEDKVSKAMVSRAVLFDATGEQNVAISNNVLSSSVPYVGDFGISRNPESFANFGFRSYFVDIKRRVVLRLSQDGLTPISEASMKNFFTDYFQEVIDNNKHIGSAFRAYGAYDNKFDEYVVSIPTISWQSQIGKPKIDGFTVGFNEPSKRWNSFYDYQNHIMTYNTELHSFQAGMVYRHNSSAVEYNTFYNVSYPSRLYFPSNMSPDATKVYNTIAEESTDIWELSITTRNGQNTTVTTQEFTNGQTFVWEEGHGTKENIHHAFIRGDVNSAGGKIEGDRIRDTSIMASLTLPVGPAQEENTLFSVKFGLTASGSPDLLGNVT